VDGGFEEDVMAGQPVIAGSLAGSHLLVVVAHPDDESFGCGSLIAHAVDAGAQVTVCCATRGEAGELSPGFELHGRDLGAVRAEELAAAAEVLGARCLPTLGLLDSGWAGEPAPTSICGLHFDELVDRVGVVLGEQRPDIVVTLAGDDGHRDHTRLRDAVIRAVRHADIPPALYLWCLPRDLMRRWATEMAELRPDTAHLALEIATLGTEPDAVTAVLDTSDHLTTRWTAIRAHRSQTSPYEGLSPALATAFLTADHLAEVSTPAGLDATDLGTRSAPTDLTAPLGDPA